MKHFRPLTAVEQLAAHLGGEIRSGALAGMLPGVHRLARDLGVSPRSVVAAVAQLQRDGLVRGQGARRRVMITPHGAGAPTALRVAILPYEASDRRLSYIHDLAHRLEQDGHVPVFAGRTLTELGRDPQRVADHVGRHPADAWVVLGGSREILQWFAAQPVPAFAMFGRRRGVPIASAGPNKQAALREVVRKLVALGHRRIVLLARGERRRPEPGAAEKAFLHELATHGIPIGAYHLPDWEETPEGFAQRLDALFSLTPPTALILDEAIFLAVAQQHLARRGILSPEHVSLVCCDADPSFPWYLPGVAHIRWDPAPVVRRITRWVENVTRGVVDRRQTDTRAEFVEGGTIGPARA